MNDKKPELERLDPESEACFTKLAAQIAAELFARVAGGDNLSTSKGCNEVSELVADAILDGFVVKERTTPRYRWVHAKA